MTEPARSGAFRDTLIVAVLAVGAVVGLVVWDGGEPSGGSAATTQPAAVTTQLAAVTTQPAAGGSTQVVTPSSPNPSDPAAVAAMAAAQDALIAVLPAPTGGAEVTPAVAGVRTWTLAGAEWQTIRDAYVSALRQQGYSVELQGPATGGATGELYTVTDPSGTISLHLTVATQNGQSVIEVTRQ